MAEPTTLEELAREVTASVPTAGRLAYGLRTSASYAAAKRGMFPLVTVNGRMRVLVQPLLRQLGVQPPSLLDEEPTAPRPVTHPGAADAA